MHYNQNRNGGGLPEVCRKTTASKQEPSDSHAPEQFMAAALGVHGLDLYFLPSTGTAEVASIVKQRLKEGDKYLFTVKLYPGVLQSMDDIVTSGCGGMIRFQNL